MNTTLKMFLPYLIVLFGLFLLFFLGQAEVAGICLLLGIVMIILSIWPEKWQDEKEK